MTRSPHTLVHRVATVAAILPVAAATLILSAPSAHAAGPSVAPTAVRAATAYSPQGVRAAISTTIRNSSQSTAAARSGAVSLVGPGGTYSLGSISVPSIPAGSSAVVRTTKVPPASTRIGSYRVRVCLAPTATNCTTSESTVSVRPHLSVSPTAIDFGTRGVGGYTSRTVTVVSDGRGAATPSISLSGADFGLDYFCGGGEGKAQRRAALTVGDTCDLLVTYNPQEVGSDTGRLTVGGGTPGPATVALSGTARLGAVFSADPESIDFGNVFVGQSATRNFVVTNTGNARAFVDLSEVDADFVLSGCTDSVGPGGSCTVTVTWTPVDSGPRSSGVGVSDDNRPVSRSFVYFQGTATGSGRS